MKHYSFTVVDSYTGNTGRRSLAGVDRFDAVRRAAAGLVGWLCLKASRVLVYDGRGRFFATVYRSGEIEPANL